MLTVFCILVVSYSQGYRETQQAIVEMTDKAAEVDAMKGSTLEDISSMVEQIGREFKSKQAQLQPLITELKVRTCEYVSVSLVFLPEMEVCYAFGF
jgi:hypothetical protein